MSEDFEITLKSVEEKLDLLEKKLEISGKEIKSLKDRLTILQMEIHLYEEEMEWQKKKNKNITEFLGN